MKEELANETVSYDTKTEAYVPIWDRSVSYQKTAVLVKFEQVSEAVVRRFSSKQVFIKCRKFHRKTPVLETLNKVAILKTLLQREFNAGVFLRNVQNI